MITKLMGGLQIRHSNLCFSDKCDCYVGGFFTSVVTVVSFSVLTLLVR